MLDSSVRAVEPLRKQRDVGPPIDAWASRLEERAERVDTVRVFANNHFTGFGPGTPDAVLDFGQARTSGHR